MVPCLGLMQVFIDCVREAIETAGDTSGREALPGRFPMARVPLIQEQDHPELAEVIEKYRSGRRGKLINMYRMLLNAPALAESWFNHSNTVRWKTSLDGRLREVVIIRMGHLTGAQYVLRQHVP